MPASGMRNNIMSSSDHVRKKSQNQVRGDNNMISSTHSTRRKIRYVPNSQRDAEEIRQSNRRPIQSMTESLDEDDEDSSSESSFEGDRQVIQAMSAMAVKEVDGAPKTPSTARRGLLGRFRSNSPKRDDSTKKKDKEKKKKDKDKKPKKDKKKKSKESGRSRSRSNDRSRGLNMSSEDDDSFAAEDILGISIQDEDNGKKKKKGKKNRKKNEKVGSRASDNMLYDDDMSMDDRVRSTSPRGRRRTGDDEASPSPRGSKPSVFSRIARSMSPGANRKKFREKRAERGDRRYARSKSPHGLIRRLSTPIESPRKSNGHKFANRLSDSFSNLGHLPLFEGNKSFHGRRSIDWDEEREYTKEELKYLERMYHEYEKMEM